MDRRREQFANRCPNYFSYILTSCLQFTGAHRITVALAAFLLFWLQFDHVVNTQDCDGGLGGELEGFDLGNGGFEHAGCLVVAHFAFMQVKTIPVK